ncbi:hypothetical protein SynROS8604_03641 [Synechococcus sp. ROS8604]|nr:hypothetical protein SynROS8604_03641 [Synechococcus sp. ROS8604]
MLVPAEGMYPSSKEKRRFSGGGNCFAWLLIGDAWGFDVLLD